ncbi:hypothetical protein GF407_08210 [candidate division KSB1 bacterium]|nr:hypothetical protein [candidate division KSB1 bacterium]
MSRIDSRIQLAFAAALLVLVMYLHFYGNSRIVLGSDELHPARTLISDDWSLTDYPWPREAVREYYKNWPIQFPPLFGLLTRSAVVCFGSNAFALRFFPALFAVLAVLLGYRLFRLYFSVSWSLVGVLLMGAASRNFIIYAKSLKHYTADVLMTVILIYLGKQLITKGGKKYWLLFITIAIAGLYLAFASVFVTVSVFVILLLVFKAREKPFRYYFAAAALLYGLFALFLYITFIAGAVSNPVFLRDWSVQILNWNRISEIDYLAHYTGHVVLHILRMSRYFFNVALPVWIAFNVLIAFWLLYLLRRKRWQELLLYLLPLFLVIVASVTGKYPFSAGRLSLFLLPVWSVMIVGGAWLSSKWLEKRSKILWILFLFAFAWAIARPVYINILKVDHYKYGGGRRVDLMMQTLKQNARKGDTVFLHWGAILPFYFYYTDHQPGYRKRYPVANDSGYIEVIYGEERSFHPEAYEKMYHKVESVPGRLWLAFAHRWPEPDMTTLLERIDRQRTRIQRWEFDGCNLVLFGPAGNSFKETSPE